MADNGPSREELEAARQTVRRLYGDDLAGKSTDSFCLAVHRSGRGRAEVFGIEALAAAPAGMPPAPVVASVVEFEPAASVPAVPRVEDLSGWGQVVSALESLAEGAVPRATSALRQALIHIVRSGGYQAMSPVYDEIERLSGTSLGPGAEVLGAPQIPSLVTQVCWLNRTVRTWAGPEVLADVAADDSVQSVDVPQRLTAEADTPNHRAIGLPPYVLRTGATGKGVIVAVIDSEVALRHPALAGRVVHRRNYTAEPWGNPHGHGTAVAGIIAGDDAADGGIAPGAVIYNYKVLARNRLLNGDSFGGAIAVQQALEDGAAVANCSWGAGPISSTKSREAIAVDTAWSLGMAVVKSAGNAGPGRSTMTVPAEADGVVAVGATDLDGTAIQRYSSRGPAGSKPGPDVLAPGGDGAIANLRCALIDGGFGDAGAGTSYAAPHVAGMFALWLEQEPHLVPDQLRERLRAAARKLARFAESAQGVGLVQLPDESGPGAMPVRRRRSGQRRRRSG